MSPLKTFVILILLVSAGCTRGMNSGSVAVEEPNPLVSEAESGNFVEGQSGQTYVAIYSHLLLRDEGLQVSLQGTMSIRNMNLKHQLKIDRIGYYKTNGDLVRENLKKPIVIKPFGSYEVVVRTSDLDGGSGAKFILNWKTELGAKNPPLVEAIFTGQRGTGTFAFLSRGVDIL